jgi:hypothetical protein
MTATITTPAIRTVLLTFTNLLKPVWTDLSLHSADLPSSAEQELYHRRTGLGK